MSNKTDTIYIIYIIYIIYKDKIVESSWNVTLIKILLYVRFWKMANLWVLVIWYFSKLERSSQVKQKQVQFFLAPLYNLLVVSFV